MRTLLADGELYYQLFYPRPKPFKQSRCAKGTAGLNKLIAWAFTCHAEWLGAKSAGSDAD